MSSAHRFHPVARVRLDMAIITALPELTRSAAGRLVKAGQVQINGEVFIKPARTVGPEHTIDVVVPPPTPAGIVAQDLPLQIVHEDDDVVVIDKAAGMVVHPGAGHSDGTLVNALLFHVRGLSGIGGVERPGIVHRLDRGTSGLLVVAKNDQAHQHLSAQFAAHTAGRTYLAACTGVPSEESGTIRSHLARHPKDRVRFASSRNGSGRHAVTHWRLTGAGRGVSLLQVELETGRTHQIRVHMSEAELPLLGDPLYGLRRKPTPAWAAQQLNPGRVLLHAWKLRFRHPADDSPREYMAPVPDDMVRVLADAEIAAP